MSAYSEEAHGKSGFFLCSFLYFLSLIIANVAIAISAVGYLSAFIPWLASGPVPLFIGSLALIWLTTAANFGGPRLTGRIGVVTVWGVIIPVVGLCVIGWFYFKVEVFVAAWNPHQFQGWDAISASIPLTLWAFLGMESAAQGHDAVEDPQRTVPLACLLGTLGAALVYVLSTTVIQGIVPNAELASASAPFAVVYAQMFAPWVGDVIMALAVVACIGSLLGWQFTLAQTAKMSADQRMFPRFFSRITQANAPLLGLLACASLQSLIALSTISPTASAQFSKLVSLAVVTNLVPYVTALTGLMVMMHKARAPQALQVRNTLVVLVAAAYSLYAIYACGEEAVFGAMLVLAFGYVLYGFLAKRFVGAGRAESC